MKKLSKQESKYRKRIICELHMDKQEQADLDSYVKCFNDNYKTLYKEPDKDFKYFCNSLKYMTKKY